MESFLIKRYSRLSNVRSDFIWAGESVGLKKVVSVQLART